MNRKVSLKIAFFLVLLLGLVLGVMYYLSSREKIKNTEPSDAVRFSQEYNEVGEDNLFVYKSTEEIIKILQEGTGVVYLGFPECPWCQRYVKYLNQIAKDKGIEKIYYTNILNDRKNNTEAYRQLVSILQPYLLKDKEGNPRIFVPDITIVKRGEIIGHNNETSLVTEDDGTPDDYWTEERLSNLQIQLNNTFESLKTEGCSNCNI